MQGFRLVSARLMGCFFAVTFSSLASAQAYKLTELDIAPQNVALYEELRELLGFEEGSYFKGITGKVPVEDDNADAELNRPITACNPWTAMDLENFSNSRSVSLFNKKTDPLKDFALNPARTSEEWLTTFCWQQEPTNSIDQDQFKSVDEYTLAVNILRLNSFQKAMAHTLLRLILSAEESLIKVDGRSDILWVKQTMETARIQFAKNLLRFLKFSQNPSYRKMADRLYDVVIRPSSCTQFADCFDFLMGIASIQEDFVGPLADEQRSQPIFDAVQKANTASFYRDLLNYQLNSILAHTVLTNGLQAEADGLQDAVLGRRLTLDQESFNKVQEFLPFIVGDKTQLNLLATLLQVSLKNRYLNDPRFRALVANAKKEALQESQKALEVELENRPEAKEDLEKLNKELQAVMEAIEKESALTPEELSKIPLPNSDVLLSFAIIEGLAAEAGTYATTQYPNEDAFFVESPDYGMYVPNPINDVKFGGAENHNKLLEGRLNGASRDKFNASLIQRTVFQLIESYHHNLALKYYVNGRLNPTDNQQNIDVFLAKIDAALNLIKSGQSTPMISADELPVSVQLYAIYFALTKYSGAELYQGHRHEWMAMTKKAAELLKARLNDEIVGSEFEFSAIMQSWLGAGEIQGLVDDMNARLEMIESFITTQLKQHQLFTLLGKDGGMGQFKSAEGEMLLTRIPGFESYVYELGKISHLVSVQSEVWQRYLANAQEVRYFDQPENPGLIKQVNELEERIVEQRLVLACYGYWLPLDGGTLITKGGRITMTLDDIAQAEFLEKKPKWQKKYVYAVDGGTRTEYDLKDICGANPVEVKASVRHYMAKESMKNHSPLLSVNTLKYTGGMMMDLTAYYMMGTAFNWGSRTLFGSLKIGRAGAAAVVEPSKVARFGMYLARQGVTLASFSLLSATYSSVKDGSDFGQTYKQHLIYGAPVFLLMPLANLAAARQIYTRSLFGYRRGVELSSQAMAEQLANYRITSPNGGVVAMSKRQRWGYHALPTAYNGLIFGLTPMGVRGVEVAMGKKNQRLFYSSEASAQEIGTGLLSAAIFRMIGGLAAHGLPGAKDMRAQRQRWIEEIGDFRGKILKQLNTKPDALSKHTAQEIAKDYVKLEKLAKEATPKGRAAEGLLPEYAIALEKLKATNSELARSAQQQISAQRPPAKSELTPLETKVNENGIMKPLKSMGWREDLSAHDKIVLLEKFQQETLIPDMAQAARRMIVSLRTELRSEMLGILKSHGYPSEAQALERLNWINKFVQTNVEMTPQMQSALKAEAGRIMTQLQ